MAVRVMARGGGVISIRSKRPQTGGGIERRISFPFKPRRAAETPRKGPTFHLGAGGYLSSMRRRADLRIDEVRSAIGGLNLHR